MILFKKDYVGNGILDVSRDITDVVYSEYDIPTDEHGFHTGTFTITVTWTKDTAPFKFAFQRQKVDHSDRPECPDCGSELLIKMDGVECSDKSCGYWHCA